MHETLPEGSLDAEYIVSVKRNGKFTVDTMREYRHTGPLLTHPDYVTVSHGMAGFYAVYLKWNAENGNGFYEPWNTSESFGSNRAAAETYAKDWAEAEEVEYRA